VRILILSQYFTPEVGATSTRVHSFAAGLAERGHHVEVICEVPNHPQGRVHDGYRGRIVRRQRLDGFRGSWVWVHTKPEKTTRDRLAFYGTYTAMASAWASLQRRPDVIFASSPPLPVGVVGCVAARRHRVPWVLDVRDLWPEAAVAVGELGSERAVRVAEHLEAFLYRDATAITAVTQPFVDHIAVKLGGTQKIDLVPNGTTSFWIDAAELEPDRARLGLPADRFVWAFAGNLGLAQGLDAAIDAAALLGPEYKLILLGDGAARPALEQRVANVAPGLVEFRDQVPREPAAELLRASDALLVSLSPDPVLESFVPSKLFDFCALGRPVLVAANGEPQRLIRATEAAASVPAGDADALATAVRDLHARPETATRLGEAGRQFAREHLRDRQVERLETILERVASR
jgi:glycosyltransferase involved in cell wall biosynthesis